MNDLSFGSNNGEETPEKIQEIKPVNYFKEELVKLDFSSYSSQRIAGHKVGEM